MTVQSKFKKDHFLKLSEIVFKKLNQRQELITKYFRECEDVEIFKLLTTTGLTPYGRVVNSEIYFLDNSWIIEAKNGVLQFSRIGYAADKFESPFESNTIFSFNIPSWNKGSTVRKIRIDIQGVHYNEGLIYDDHDGIIDYDRIPQYKNQNSRRSFETEKNKNEGEERIHIFIKNLDNYLIFLNNALNSDIARINKVAPDIVRQLLNKANNEQEAKAIEQDKTTGQNIGRHRDSLPSSQARFENRTLAEKIAHTKQRLLELEK